MKHACIDPLKPPGHVGAEEWWPWSNLLKLVGLIMSPASALYLAVTNAVLLCLNKIVNMSYPFMFQTLKVNLLLPRSFLFSIRKKTKATWSVMPVWVDAVALLNIRQCKNYTTHISTLECFYCHKWPLTIHLPQSGSSYCSTKLINCSTFFDAAICFGNTDYLHILHFPEVKKTSWRHGLRRRCSRCQRQPLLDLRARSAGLILRGCSQAAHPTRV